MDHSARFEAASLKGRPPRPGALPAREARAIAYDDDDPDYFRALAARYYDRAIVFIFSGPATRAKEVDLDVDKVAEEIQWREQ